MEALVTRNNEFRVDETEDLTLDGRTSDDEMNSLQIVGFQIDDGGL